ncbi:putative urease accessory protein UreD [Lupinus albus]|uniref:Putative urease accessory protein UreD n=1 Tax=Lupinus albus TaxID=3870 RepID=A0A6A4NK34_LUPAL|nr:putative urease accessory protein UreD [Lupinus albus]
MRNSKDDKEVETGSVVVEKVGGRSSVTSCLSRYPLKFVIPRKVGSSKTDVVWVYALTYGGGIVSGDHILCKFSVEDACTMVLTTQASTKVYKSEGSKVSQQILEARVGSNALLAIIPDPVTCFSTARYYQKQILSVSSDSNLVIVDWITSGRYESGEKWDFDLYRSTNNIFLEDGQPLFLDTILLDKEKMGSIQEHMQDYQVIAMIILLGPKMQCVQNLVQDHVKKLMSEQLQLSPAALRHQRDKADHSMSKPSFVASCSVFGPKKIGLVVRVAAMTTESVYMFLRHQLAPLEVMLGVPPYR